METLVIIIIVVVIVGIAIAIASPLLAAKSANKGADAFTQAYKSTFNTAPSEEASRAIATGIGVIASFSGSGKEDLGRERLSNCIADYAQAVGYNEEKIEVGLVVLGAACCNRNMEPAHGYKWAADVVEAAITLYCPSLMREIYGRL